LLYNTIAEYNEEIADTKLAIKAIKKIGAETSNNSGGSSRSFKSAELNDLTTLLAQLQREKNILAGDRDCVFIGRMGW